MLRFAALAALAAVACVLASSAAPADDTKLNVKEGDKFPAVPLAAAQIDKVKKDAKTVSIADLKGKVVVIFFYPKALTKGCTVESCGFRDLMKAEDFPKDVVLLGASGDTVEKQQEFIDKEKLPMALLADTEQKLMKELGILSKAGATTPKRMTFVVDKEGKIAKIYEKVDVNKHPKDVLEFVKSLK